MSREIDERVVAMYFNNTNFERNAKKTIQTLDELKRGMNMEGVGKGLEVLEEFQKKLDLEKVQKSAEKLKTTINGVGNALKSTFNFVTSPLHAFSNAFKELNSYVTQMAGIDIGGKIVHGIENALRGLTIAPVSAGWNQYESTMDSIKTIMSSTGEELDTVKDKLGELTQYANQTIYSLSDMTSNIGKFTNNGVKLNDATNAMIGLANATADAGQGAAQASMAMYNVSQAIGVGKMTTIDWKSLENANIATVKLKQTLIDSAVAAGKLEKKMVKNKKTGKEELQYWTKAEKGSKKMQVSVENFRDSLSKGWLSKEAMMSTFAIYSGQLSADEIAALGFSKEESARLYEIGQEAMKAATEVRTFSKMMDALKEGVQSSWATSFEYIFGDMKEGTNLWTELNGRIEEVLNKGAENRNNILMTWRGMMKDENGNVRKIQDVFESRKQQLYADWKAGYINEAQFKERMHELTEKYGDPEMWKDYRQVAVDAFLDMFDVIKSVAGEIKGAWEDVFGVFDADSLKRLTQGFSDFVARVKEWLGDSSDAESRISKIRRGLTGVFSVLRAGLTVIKTLIQGVWTIVKPLIDPIIDLFAKLGDWLNLKDAKTLGDVLGSLGKKFSEFWGKISNLGFSGVLGKIGDWFVDLGNKIWDGLSTWLNEQGLSGVVDWFVSLGDSIKMGYEKVKEWWESGGGKPIREFFQSIWSSITDLFTPKLKYGYRNGNLESWYEDAPIVAWFKGIWKGIQDAYEGLSGWWNDPENGIHNFFTGIFDAVSDAFKGGENGEDAPIVAWFKGVWEGIKSTYESLSSWWNDPQNGIHNFFNSIFETVSSAFTAGGDGSDAPIVAWFKKMKDGVVEAFDKLKQWWTDLGADKFFAGIWNTMTSAFKPTLAYGYVNGRKESWYEDAPIVSFFKNIWEGLKSIWDKITGFFDDSGISQFFSNVWEWIKGLFTVDEADNGDEAPIVKFFNSIGKWLEDAWNNVKAVFTEDSLGIGKFFSDAWEWIKKTLGISQEIEINDYETPLAPFVEAVEVVAEEAKETSKDLPEEAKEVPIVKFFLDVKEWLIQAFDEVKQWWEGSGIPDFFQRIWDAVSKAFKPKLAYGYRNGRLESWYEDAPIVAWFKNLYEGIKGVWESITGWSGWADIGKFFSDAWGWIADKFSGSAPAPTTEEMQQAEAKTGFFDSLLGTLSGIWDTITEWFTKVGGHEIGERVIGTITKFVEAVAVLMEHVVTLFNHVVTGNLSGEEIAEIVTLISVLLGSKLWYGSTLKKLGNIATGAEGIGTTVLKIAGGIALVALAVSMLSSLDPDKMWPAVTAVAVVGVIIAAIFNYISKVKAAGAKANPETVGERIAKQAITAVTMAGVIAESLALLPNIIEKVSKIGPEANGDAILKTFEGIAILLGAIILSIGIFSKLSSGGSLKGAAVGALSIVVGIGILLVGLDAVFSALIGLDEQVDIWSGTEGSGYHQEHIKRLQAAVETVQLIGDALGSFFGAIAGGFAGAKEKYSMIHMSEGMEEAASILSDVKIEDMQHMADLVGILQQMQENLPDYDSFIDKWINGDKLGLLGDNVGRLGAGLAEMVKAVHLSEKGDIGEIRSYVDLLTGFAATVDVLYKALDIANIYRFSGDSSEAAFQIGQSIDMVYGLYREAAQKLAQAVQEGLGESGTGSGSFFFDAQPIISAIIKGLESGKTNVAKAVRAMIQFGLDSYSPTEALGEGAVHTTGEITSSLTNLYNKLTSSGITSLFGEGGLSSLLTPILGELGDENKLTSLFSGYEDTFSTFGETLGGKLGDSIDLDFGGMFETDESGMPKAFAGLQDQWDAAVKAAEESGEMDLSLEIRPVFVMEDLNSGLDKLRENLANNPVSLKTVLNIGDQALPVADIDVLSEVKLIHTDMNAKIAGLEIAITGVSGTLSSKIEALGDDIAQMKLVLDTGELVGGIAGQMDEELYRRSVYGNQTGVVYK